MYLANLNKGQLIPIIEKYLLTSDKGKFLAELQDNSNEKKFLKLFTTSNGKQLDQYIKYFNLSEEVSRVLKLRNLIKNIEEQKNKEKQATYYLEISKLLNLNNDYYQSVISNETFMNEVKTNFEDNLDQNQIKLSKYFANNIKNTKLLNSITNYGLIKLTDTEINQFTTVEQYENYLNRIDLASLDDKIFPLLKKYHQLANHANKNFKFQLSIYIKLSELQLKKLADSFPNVLKDQQYFKILFEKSFKEQLNKFNKSNKDLPSLMLSQKRQLLKKIVTWLKKFKINFLTSLINQINYEILYINTILEVVDLNLFIDFLNKPNEEFKFFNQTHKKHISSKKIQDQDDFWDDTHNLNVSQWPNQKSLISTILQQLFWKDDDKVSTLQKFYTYFQQQYVNTIFYKTKLKKGQIIENLQNYLPKEIIKQAKDSKELTIRDNNKRQFKLGEDILITIRTKNIKDLTLLVYQINLQKHYLTSGTDIDAQISLNFIEPFKRIQKNINVQNPFKIQDIQINLHEILENKPSVYIVQFQGEGISSRAVIKRGSIICLQRQTLSGVELKFYDEQGKNIQQLDLWIQRKKVTIKNKYIIPYGTTHRNVGIVAVKNQFAQLFNIIVNKEQYKFHVNYIYHEENFLVGTKAKVLLQPHLLSYQNQVSLQFLKTNQITVKLLNHQNIQSTFQIANFSWDPKNQYQLQIPIQTYIKKIQIIVNSTTRELYSGKPQNFTSNHEIIFRDPQTDNNFAQLYLTKQIGNGYIIKVLGKNGEPKHKILVTVNLYSTLFNNPIIKTLKTNQKGYIILGQLKDIHNIQAQVNLNQKVINSWEIQRKKKQVYYQNEYYVLVNEQISLPLTQDFNFQHDFTFLRYNHNSDLISNEKKNAEIKNGRLIAKFYTSGLYKLYFRHIYQTITIFVVQGKYWENKTQIYNQSQRQLITLKINPHSSIGINNQLRVKEHENFNEYSIDLNILKGVNLEGVRAHIIASAFIYQKSRLEKMREKLIPFQSNEYTFPQNKCIYLSNKQLSDEHCYVLARKNQNKFIGNNLQKPRILLKRTLNRDTNNLQQQLKVQKQYQARQNNRDQKMCRKKMKRADDCQYANKKDFRLVGHSTNNNFLLNSSIILANLHGQTLNFKLQKHYQNFTIIIDSPFFAIEKFYSLKEYTIPIRDLRHIKTKQGIDEQGLTISRQVYRLFSGQNLKVNRNSLWMATSSNQIEIYAKAKGFKLWDWVLKWNTYNQTKKQDVYNEFCCHQLNTFIKFHDPQFFKNIVRPFISNKLQKSVVDLCLIEHQGILKYTNIINYRLLNPFEKCLLISVLIKLKLNPLAKNIASNIELEEKSRIYPYQQYQNYFDIVMTSQKISKKSIMIQAQRKQNLLFMKMKPIQQISQKKQKKQKRDINEQQNAQQNEDDYQQSESQQQQQLIQRRAFKAGFKQIEKTKEYVQTTYYGINKQKSNKSFISSSKFWVDLSNHLLQKSNEFISQNFMYLNSASQFALAIAFLPKQSNPKFNLSNQGEWINIAAQNSFLVYVKEVKSVPYKKKYGILINQRFYDPSQPYIYQSDGTKIQNSVQQFVKDTIYVCQTVVTNTSVANLQLQILIDLPEGSIPIQSKQYTKVINQTLNSYQTKSIEVKFYFPQAGQFSIYPANVSKNGLVIAKAQKTKDIIVNDCKKIIKLETFTDILRSGTKSDIIKFIRQKNIFDNNTFKIDQILWLLKDKEFYQEVIKIFTQRFYFNQVVWGFSTYHQDVDNLKKNLQLIFQSRQFGEQQIFEYYPLSSKRAHKFMDQNKSGILNVEFKNTYNQFLFSCLFLHGINNISVNNVIAFTYYLLLQDRIQQASKILKTIDDKISQITFPKIQYDYLKCYLDIYTGYPNFTIAREISIKYINYPIITWRKLFKDVYDLLYTHDNTIFVEEAMKEHQIKIYNKGNYLSLVLPEKTTIEVYFHAVNLQLFFSESPFMDVNIFSTVKPFKTERIYSENGGEIKIQKPNTYPDIYVQPTEITTNRNPQKLNSFLWPNQNVKVKVVEQSGYAIVYLDGKQKSGAYCKVYAKGSKTRFYRDGYTDIQGRFQYINAQLDDISEFALLFLTDSGGVIKYAKIPNLNGNILL